MFIVFSFFFNEIIFLSNNVKDFKSDFSKKFFIIKNGIIFMKLFIFELTLSLIIGKKINLVILIIVYVVI